MRGQLIKRYFITGLLIWVPLVITGWVLSLIVSTLDQSLRLLPTSVHPQTLFGFAIPGAGAVLTLVMILLTGLLAANFIGQKLVVWWEKLLARIPVVNSVYNSVKQVSDTLFSPNGNAFRKALLVQYPRQGSWTVAFLTGTPGGDIINHLEGEHVSVYVPTTPNPTSGYLEIVPVELLTPTDWTVDQAMSFIISGGAVSPESIPFTRAGER